MEYIYSIGNKARSGEEDAQNENLLTGVLVWVIERYTHLISKIIDKSIYFGDCSHKPNYLTDRTKFELELLGIDISLPRAKKRERLDAIFKGENIEIVFENKTVKIGEANSLTHNQITKYCKILESSAKLNWIIIIITPDSDLKAKNELNLLDKKYHPKIFWISWQRVWEIVKNLLDDKNIHDYERMVLQELKGGIELANLKPFEGFSEKCISVMSNMNPLDELIEFLNAVKDLMENDPEINMVRKEMHREHEGHEYTACIWPKYVESGEDGTIYYGPWFRLDKRLFSVYVEFDDWAEEAHKKWMEKNVNIFTRIKIDMEKQWSSENVSFEYEESGYYLTVPINHEILRSVKLLEFVKKAIVSLKEQVINPMQLKTVCLDSSQTGRKTTSRR